MECNLRVELPAIVADLPIHKLSAWITKGEGELGMNGCHRLVTWRARRPEHIVTDSDSERELVRNELFQPVAKALLGVAPSLVCYHKG
jgi:hypothetical protein